MIDIEQVKLEYGSHYEGSQRFCVMELAAYLAHEPWNDSPECASPVIAAFLRSWNDSLDDETRQKLKPYARRVIGTRGSAELEERRSFLALDWLIRTHTVAWLRLANLTEHADTLAALPPQTSLEAVKSSAAASAAARAAASAAARDAAWAAASAAARDAAWAAASAAARDAAWAAAWAEFKETVAFLQQSAFALLDQMIELSE